MIEFYDRKENFKAEKILQSTELLLFLWCWIQIHSMLLMYCISKVQNIFHLILLKWKENFTRISKHDRWNVQKRLFFQHSHYLKALKSPKAPNKKLTQLIVNVHGKELYQYQCLPHKSHLRTLLYADRKYLGLFIVCLLYVTVFSFHIYVRICRHSPVTLSRYLRMFPILLIFKTITGGIFNLIFSNSVSLVCKQTWIKSLFS